MYTENWVFEEPTADEIVEEPTAELISNADIETTTKPPTQDDKQNDFISS